MYRTYNKRDGMGLSVKNFKEKLYRLKSETAHLKMDEKKT